MDTIETHMNDTPKLDHVRTSQATRDDAHGRETISKMRKQIAALIDERVTLIAEKKQLQDRLREIASELRSHHPPGRVKYGQMCEEKGKGAARVQTIDLRLLAIKNELRPLQEAYYEISDRPSDLDRMRRLAAIEDSLAQLVDLVTEIHARTCKVSR